MQSLNDKALQLSPAQQAQLELYAELLARYTTKLNLISPSTIPFIQERHIAHCLLIARRGFPEGATIVDWGTGGGLPLIPLSIVFPAVQFIGIDAVGKKLQAIRAMARTLKLLNLDTWHGRAEEWDGTLHYSVSRATAPLRTLWGWHVRCFQTHPEFDTHNWPQGLICLKGGDLKDEIASLHAGFPSLNIEKSSIAQIERASFFKEKYILHICDTLE